MKDLQEQTYYEILEIEPNASQEDILKAYNKARTTYSTNSPALYSLMNKEEAQELLRLIDEAYAVLSNQFKRKQYDKTGVAPGDSLQPAEPPPPPAAPPEDFAIPSATAHEAFDGLTTATTSSVAFTSSPSPPQVAPPSPPPIQAVPQAPPAPQADTVVSTRFGKYRLDTEIENEIRNTEEFTGPFLQKIRNYKNISLDQISDITKVSRPYLTAIENNDFACLPATVFVRGFLVQMAKALGLNGDKVANTYLRVMKGVQKK